MIKRKVVCKHEEKILICVKNGINYNEKISKELKIKPNALIVLLNKLKKERMVLSVREKKFNKRIYFLTSRGSLLLNYYKDLEKFRKKYLQFIKKEKKQ